MTSSLSYQKASTQGGPSVSRYAEAQGRLQEETFASKARLVLHFDVNKTIIMLDKAQVECKNHQAFLDASTYVQCRSVSSLNATEASRRPMLQM